MEEKIYPVLPITTENAYFNSEQYQALYQYSISDPEGFWSEQALQFISWFKPWEQIKDGDFAHLNTRWFIGGKLNACYNCLDRHLESRGDKIAIIWEGDEPSQSLQLSYKELHALVCRFANVLTQQGVAKGDRVCIYLPMIPEVVIAMLACARIGAVHSVVFAGFSPEALHTRLIDADCHIVVTADEGMRAGKRIPLKANTDQAVQLGAPVDKVIVVKRSGSSISWQPGRDIWYHEAMAQVSADCPIEAMDAADPLFILYTSGSTGQPKGILHVTGGYLVYAALTHKYVFNYHEYDIYWCTADAGWITGHTYVIYGPLANGATTVLFEGAPFYPNYARYWEIIDKYRVNIFYTSPTAIRALRHEGDDWVTQTKRSSLKLLGTVGEPINPDVWEWFYEEVGEQRCPIVDTWWQTETGGILITPLPGATPLKPGSASWPFFGVLPAIVDDAGNEITDNTPGNLVIKQPWPGLATTIYGNPARYKNAYFHDFPNLYLTGDTAHRDVDGYYWISGRNDDVIKVSGHRIGTGEVENALLTHPAVSEAAVVAIPNDIKGHGIYAYVTIRNEIMPTEALKVELIQQVRQVIGSIAAPEFIQWAPRLPKTRSGKIMRRILRKIACNEGDLGDTSTLAEPDVVQDLLASRKADL